MTIRLCKICGDWHSIAAPWPCVEREPSKAAAFPTPMFSSDTMRAVKSQMDGKMYDSKSAIRQHYRETGAIEIGNERMPARDPIKPTTNADIHAALKSLN